MSETLYLTATGPAASALTPGAVLRALALGAGVYAEEVLSLQPLGARRVAVTLTGARARAVSTPRVLAPAGAPAPTWTLRRLEDPPEDGTLVALATWDAGETPTPGALGRALHDALGPDVGAEELGVTFAGASFAHVQLPGRLAAVGLPAELSLAGAPPDGGGPRAVRLRPLHEPPLPSIAPQPPEAAP